MLCTTALRVIRTTVVYALFTRGSIFFAAAQDFIYNWMCRKSQYKTGRCTTREKEGLMSKYVMALDAGTTSNRCILFNVLKNGEASFGGYTLLLDCATILEARAFDGESPYSNVWGSSPIKTYLNGEFKTNRFTSREIAAIHESRKSATGTGDGNGGSSLGWASLNGEKIFLLDAKEATNTSYGFENTEDPSSTREKTGTTGWWWLRSPYSSEGYYAGCVDEGGYVVFDKVNHHYIGVSPALNVDLKSVMFSSLISGTAGQPGAEYKLTLIDENLKISPGAVTRDGTTITVPYTITGNDANTATQVSVLIMDGPGGYTYTKLTVDSWGTSGTGTFTLPNEYADKTWGSDYHVYILAEDVNGEKETDYASMTVEIKELTVNASATGYEGTYDGQAHGITVSVTDPANEVTIKYGETAESCTAASSPTIMNVSDSPKTVYYQVEAEGYLTASGSATVTISKAELTITANDQTYEYNGQNQGPGDVAYADPAEIAKMVTAVGLQGNDAITSVVVDGQGKDVGTHEIIPSNATVNGVSASENYDVKYINGTLKIQLPISYTVTFKVVNGSWNDGTSTDKTVTLTGYKGDMLKLTSDQIPAVGSKPNDTFKAGSWDVTPSTETAITGATTYTYTYSQKDTAVVKTAPTAKALTYTGSAQELITAGAASGGTMQYALGTVTEATQSYTASIPTGTNVGTYYVWYKVIGDANHLDYIELQPIAVTIAAGGETQARMEQRPLDSVPAELAHLYGSVEEIRRDMMLKVSINGEPVKAENTFLYDVALLVSFDGGRTWLPATEENFPAEGIQVTLLYPAGTNGNDFDFAVSHMFTVTSRRLGTTAGGIEVPAVTKTAEGLRVLFRGLSPVLVSWARKGEKPEPSPTVTIEPTATPAPTVTPGPLPKTGDSANPVLWLGMIAAGLAMAIAARSVKKRRDR